MEKAMDKQANVQQIKTASDILREMEQNLKSSSPPTVLVPNSAFYEVTLQAFAVSDGGGEAAEHAEQILRRMIANCQNYCQTPQLWRYPPICPSVKAFNICIDAWAKSTEKEAGFHAERILELMEDWSNFANENEIFSDCKPSTYTFVGILNAWAKSRHPLAPDRSLQILTSLVKNESYSNLLIQPLFNVGISIWARSGRGRSGAEQCDELVNLMIRLSSERGLPLSPDAVTIASQIDGWAACEQQERAGESADRAQSILMHSVEAYKLGKGPLPNATCFCSCISARAHARSTDFSSQCENIWDMMVDLYKTTGSDPLLKPDVHTANAVLAAYSRDRRRHDSAARAVNFLRKMEKHVSPDIVSYNSILDLMGKRGMSSDARRLLSKMNNSESKAKPDIISYNCVLTALAKDPGATPEDVESLISDMDHLAGSKNNFKPDKVSFTIAIDAWARSTHPTRVDKANRLLKEMIRRNEKGDKSAAPDVFVLTALLKTCASAQNSPPTSKKDALGVALEAIQTIFSGKYGKVGDITYSTMTKAVDKLCEDHLVKSRLLRTIFERSAADGALSKQVFATAMRHGVATLTLKSSWSKNVPPAHKPIVPSGKHGRGSRL